MKDLGHLLRCDVNSPERQVAIDDDLNNVFRTYKRVGQPKQNWVNDCLKNVTQLLFGEQFDGSEEQCVNIFCAGSNYEF